MVFKELVGFGSATASLLVEEALKTRRGRRPRGSVRYPCRSRRIGSPALAVAVVRPLRQGWVHPAFISKSVRRWSSWSAARARVQLTQQMGAWDRRGRWCSNGIRSASGSWIRACLWCGVQLRGPALKQLAAAGATLVTCPRGNVLTGAGEPPVAEFYGSGARVAVGTDSLASVPDLNLFSELAELRRLGPGVPARAIVASATINGARALGFENELGTIEQGKQSALIAVALPHGVSDPEEYLLSGIPTSQICWLDGPGRVGEPPTGA